jgi:YVTN family beta-propeller protein
VRVVLALVGAVFTAIVAAWIALAVALPKPKPEVAAVSSPPIPKEATSAKTIASSAQASSASSASIDRPKRTGPIPKLEVQEVEATGLQPKGAFLSHDGKRLYVTNFGELSKKKCVSVYDADSLALVDEIDLPGEAVEAAVSPDDKTLYVSSFWGHSLMFVDLATKTVTHDVKTGAHPKVVAASPDGKRVYVANWSGDSVAEIDTATAELVKTHPTGKSPRGLTVAKDGTVYSASFYADTIEVYEGAERETHRKIPVCKCPRHLALSPDDKTLYISCLYASQIHALDLATGKVTHKAQVGASPKSVAVSRDGRYVWSAEYGGTRSVSVVDTTDWTARTFVVPGMDRGSGIAVGEGGEHAFVTGWYDAHVYRVGFEGTGGHPKEAMAKINRWIGRPFSPDPGDGQ